jgi:RNA polymerase sigma-54 factor
MALGARLEFRQSQSLVMTPQLLQAIRLLQLSAPELQAYVETELERNPMLERADIDSVPAGSTAVIEDVRRESDWSSDDLRTDTQAIAREFGSDAEMIFPEERVVETRPVTMEDPQRSLVWETRSSGGSTSVDEDPDLEAYVASNLSLHDHLETQLGQSSLGAVERLIGEAIIATIDENGYVSEPITDLARRLGVSEDEALAVLEVVQSFDPIGVGARDLAECLCLQLKELGRLDPAIEAVVRHLDLLAKRDFAGLRRVAKVDQEDLSDIVTEIRRLNPKPGAVFGSKLIEAVTPDVYISPTSNGGWRVDLNSAALPRVLANKSYYAEVVSVAKTKEARHFIDEAWQSANWLTRSLEQRAKTILKVASEIVRQQDAFFVHGVTRLRPMNLKTVAEQVGLHESTISRVTANKFMVSPRGIFEMKYFFTAAIASSDGEEAHSAEAVRHHIKTMIEGETVQAVLSDEALVDRLKALGIDVARRTVAKYREALRIPSSSIRRREKRAINGG